MFVCWFLFEFKASENVKPTFKIIDNSGITKTKLKGKC